MHGIVIALFLNIAHKYLTKEVKEMNSGDTAWVDVHGTGHADDDSGAGFFTGSGPPKNVCPF